MNPTPIKSLLASLLIAGLVAGIGVGTAQEKDQPALKVTLEELAKEPAKFQGKRIQVDGVIQQTQILKEKQQGFDYRLVVGKDDFLLAWCAGKLTVGKGDSVRITGEFRHDAAAANPYRILADDKHGMVEKTISGSEKHLGNGFAAHFLGDANGFLATRAPIPKDVESPFMKDVQSAREKAINFLKLKQSKTGSWEHGDGNGVPQFTAFEGGLTALVVVALLEAGVAVDDPAIAKAVEYLAQIPPRRRTSSACRRGHWHGLRSGSTPTKFERTSTGCSIRPARSGRTDL